MNQRILILCLVGLLVGALRQSDACISKEEARALIRAILERNPDLKTFYATSTTVTPNGLNQNASNGQRNRLPSQEGAANTNGGQQTQSATETNTATTTATN